MHMSVYIVISGYGYNVIVPGREPTRSGKLEKVKHLFHSPKHGHPQTFLGVQLALTVSGIIPECENHAPRSCIRRYLPSITIRSFGRKLPGSTIWWSTRGISTSWKWAKAGQEHQSWYQDYIDAGYGAKEG